MRTVPTIVLLAVLGACTAITPARLAPEPLSAVTVRDGKETDRPRVAGGEGLPEVIDDFLARSPSWPRDTSLLALAEGGATTAEAPPQSTAGSKADLAKKTQNPISDLISLPIQNNTGFNYGYDNDVQNVTNIQPVYPVSLNENWNLINRAILPVIYQPAPVPGVSSDFGLGDTLYTGFFSPKDSGKVIWGIGPTVLIPTSTGNTLGAGEWGLGASAVALTIRDRWVFGALIANVWSFEGSVNSLTLQPFVNYNLPKGWYLSSVPIITANWEAPSGEQWTVPLGGGVGKITKIGKQPINLQVQAFYNVDHPSVGPEWTLRFQIQFLFPK
jgi:hypothetical protein